MKLTEFYPEMQGRPGSKVALDNETRGPSIPPGYITGVMLSASYSGTTIINNYTATDKTLMLVNAGAGSVNITLPEASVNSGKYYIIKKVDSSGNVVTIKGNVISEKIDGETSITLSLQYQYVTVICDGSNWYIIGGEYVKMEDILNQILEVQEDTCDEVKLLNTHMENITDLELNEEDINERH